MADEPPFDSHTDECRDANHNAVRPRNYRCVCDDDAEQDAPLVRDRATLAGLAVVGVVALAVWSVADALDPPPPPDPCAAATAAAVFGDVSAEYAAAVCGG